MALALTAPPVSMLFSLRTTGTEVVGITDISEMMASTRDAEERKENNVLLFALQVCKGVLVVVGTSTAVVPGVMS